MNWVSFHWSDYIDQACFKNTIALSAIPDGYPWAWQKYMCFRLCKLSSGTGVHLGHCIIFSDALGWPPDMADDAVHYS